MNDEQRFEEQVESGDTVADILEAVYWIGYNDAAMPTGRTSRLEKARGYASAIADRAVTTTVAEPDAETVERVAKAMFQSLRPLWGDDIPEEEIPEGDDPEQYYEYSISWEQWNKYGYGLDYDSLSEMRADDLRKLARAAIAAMPSCADAEWLDDALEPFSRCEVGIDYEDVVGGFWANLWLKSNPLIEFDGTGTTRREAILDAVAKAKGASDAS